MPPRIDVKTSLDSKNELLYVRCDLVINNNLTELSWDCNLVGGAIQSGYIATYDYIYPIESFNNKREIRVDVHDANRNNIYIYIEKKFFEQQSFYVNPFHIKSNPKSLG